VEGRRPNLAIFLDGLNEYYHVRDEPGFSEQIGELFENCSSIPYHLRFLAGELPLVRAFRDRRFPEPAGGKVNEDFERMDILESIQKRYLENQKNTEAVAAANGVKTLFVWQPIPFYKYKGNHPFQMPGKRARHIRSKFGYPMMAEYVGRHEMQPNFLYLADMQEELSGMLYVDIVHYSGRMSREVAARIEACLRERKLLE